MNRMEIINKIEKELSLYKEFIRPDFPTLNVYVKQYQDILVELFKHEKNPYSIIYTDVNKLSVVNERYGKETGDRTLYSLLCILLGTTSPFYKNSFTIRAGGDEFITFVPNMKKEQVQKHLKVINSNVERQKDHLYGSSLALAAEDSTSGNFEHLINLAEQQIHYQKNKNRKKDTFLTQASNSNIFVQLPVPENISEDQQEYWEILNTKINILIDNHLRDVRPSSHFKYEVNNIQDDAHSFIYAFSNLLETSNKSKELSSSETDLETKPVFTYKTALAIHTLFQGKSMDFSEFSDKELDDLHTSLNLLCENLIRNKHSGLLSKSYYNIYLADKLLDSNKTWQAVYYSASGIRPSNTAYGYVATDNKIKKTSSLLVNELYKKRDFNDTPFTFNVSDCFLIDQSGGNYMALIPKKSSLTEQEVKEIENAVNSHYTDGSNSTLQVASSFCNRVNKRSIRFFINSSANFSLATYLKTIYQMLTNTNNKWLPSSSGQFAIYSNKPFVQFARKLKENCNNNKDSLKENYLSSNVNKDSIEAIAGDCIQYYLNKIDNADSIETKKFLMENVMLALLNHEDYVNRLNEQLLHKKQENRKIFKYKSNSDLLDRDERG